MDGTLSTPQPQRMSGRSRRSVNYPADSTNFIQKQLKEHLHLEPSPSSSPPQTTLRHYRPIEDIQSQIDIAIAHREGVNGGRDLNFPVSVLTQTDSTQKCQTTASSQPLEQGYEHLDHSADVMLHSWGPSLAVALGELARSMFAYMTDIDTVVINNKDSDAFGANIVATGHDLYSLIYAFLDEWLFVFHDTGFVPAVVRVSDLIVAVGGNDGEVNSRNNTFQATSVGQGERMDLGRHVQGTEVKAITYGSMKVEEGGLDRRCDIWVIVDI